MKPTDAQAPFDTFWANGACFLLRVGMIHEIGLLDDNMLFIFSDCDYSFTARSRGWKICVVPTAFCEHALNTSGGKASPQLEAVMLADQLYFAAKWLNGVVYKHLAYEGPVLSGLVVRGEFRQSIEALRSAQHHFGKFDRPSLHHKVLDLLNKELK